MVTDTTIKVKYTTSQELNKRKGHNGCVSADDVIQYLLKEVKKHE